MRNKNSILRVYTIYWKEYSNASLILICRNTGLIFYLHIYTLLQLLKILKIFINVILVDTIGLLLIEPHFKKCYDLS